MNQRVLIPKTPRSVLYHAPGCEKVNAAAANEVARQDAEAIGRKPAPCARGPTGESDRDDEHPPEVPA